MQQLLLSPKGTIFSSATKVITRMLTNRAITAALIGLTLLASGCVAPPGRGTAAGTALGAAAGAAIGSLSADAGKGTLIGAGAGAIGGYLVDSQRMPPPNNMQPPPNNRRPMHSDHPCAPGFRLTHAGRCVR